MDQVKEKNMDQALGKVLCRLQVYLRILKPEHPVNKMKIDCLNGGSAAKVVVVVVCVYRKAHFKSGLAKIALS